MKILGVANNIRSFLEDSMETWRTELTSYGETMGEVRIRRGIFQGDSLSPLLFVLSMIPLTLVLRKTGIGYEWREKQSMINHLLYIDDLKLFGKTENQIDSLINTVYIFSKDIGMEFGLTKCGILVLKRGKVVKTDGVVMPDGDVMRQIEDDGYKYLGIMEMDQIMESTMKAASGKEYLRRLQLILKSQLNGKNKVLAINSWAISVLRYGAGVINWNMEEVKKLDRRTRKMMTNYGALHPESDVDGIYLPRKNGGRGLLSCEYGIRSEKII